MQVCLASLQSDMANWPDINNVAFFVISLLNCVNWDHVNGIVVYTPNLSNTQRKTFCLHLVN